MNPAQLGPTSPEIQGSGSVGSSGWREKAEDCPWEGLELNRVGDGVRNEKGQDTARHHISYQALADTSLILLLGTFWKLCK